MRAEYIRKEIVQSESQFCSAPECVTCGKEQTPIDIATQAIHEPSAGIHCCQTCLWITPEDIAPEMF